MAETPTIPDFTDTSRWTCIQDVPVFEERYDQDDKGQIVNRIDHARLDRIVATCNDRDAKGILCPLSVGHTREGVPEPQQPVQVGYARHFQTTWDDKLQKWVIRATYYLRREQETFARSFPWTSVEHWRKDDFLAPIALIRQTPKCDLPPWSYQRGADVDHYSRTNAMHDPTKAPDASDPEKGFHEKVMKSVHSEYPHLKAMHEAHAAQYAAPATPGATNMGLPGQTHNISGEQAGGGAAPMHPAVHHPPVAGAAPTSNPTEKFSTDAEAIRYQRQQQQIDALQHQLKQGKAENYVKQLVYEGYDVDAAAECQQFLRLPEPQWEAHMAYVRAHYRRAPVGQPLVQTHPGLSHADLPQPDKLPDDEIDAARYDKALEYVRSGKSTATDPATRWKEAVAYAKNGAAK